MEVPGGQVLPDAAIAAAAAIQPPSPTLEESPDSAGVPLPETWVEIAARTGVTLQTTDDLTAELVAAALAVAPQLLADLTPEMILAEPQEVVDAVPAERIAELGAEQQQAFSQRSAGEAAGASGVPLPESWISAAQAQGLTLATTADLFPQLVAGIAGFAPQMLAELTPDMLLSTSPEALAALPQEFLEGLEANLQDQLNALIALVEAEDAGAEEFVDSPPLAGAWLEPPEGGGASIIQTAAELMNSGFAATAAELLNLLPGGQPTAPALLSDLSP